MWGKPPKLWPEPEDNAGVHSVVSYRTDYQILSEKEGLPSHRYYRQFGSRTPVRRREVCFHLFH